MNYEEIDNRIQRLRDDNLSELIEEAIAGEWDKAAFQKGVEQSLVSGAFILIIVVDAINEELRRIIRYINECSKSVFSLHALEMHRFQADEIEMLVPRLYGVSAKPPTRGSRRKKWSEEEFFRVLNENVKPDITSTAKDLYEWGEQTADRIWFGTGAETGSFTFHYLRDSKTLSVFTIYTTGRLHSITDGYRIK